MQPKYPDVHVQLTGRNGNAFFVLGTCLRAMKEAGLPEDERKRFQTEAMSGDYNNLIETCQKWFVIE